MSSSRLKSSAKGSASGIGLEFFGKSFRALCLERESGFLSISGLAYSDPEEQDDFEEIEHALKRLSRNESKACIRQNIGLALPQTCTTEIFLPVPENMPQQAMRNHAQSHIAPITEGTDISFVYDSQVCKSCLAGMKNIVVSIVQQETLEGHCARIGDMQFRTHKITSRALAIASAFIALHTKLAESQMPQILLNLEEDSTAMAIVSNGSVQFTGCLSFGYRNLTVSLKKSDITGRPLLKNELENALSRWAEFISSSQDVPPRENLRNPISFWISGQQNSVSQFSEMLSSIVPDAQVGLFGIPGNMLPTQDSILHTELTVPFGLALQSIGESQLTISLLPQRLKWLERKYHEFPFLAASSAMLVFGLLSLLLGMLVHQHRMREYLDSESDNLKTCSILLPQVEKSHDKMAFYQLRMLPVSEALHRTHRFLEALQLWQDAQATDNADESSWGIYLADEFSFQKANAADETAPVRIQTPARNFAVTGEAMFPGDLAPQASQPLAVPRINMMNVNSIELLKGICIGGIVPMGKSRYKLVKDLQSKFVDTGTYVNVDDHSDELSAKFTETYYSPWLAFLKDNAAQLESEYTTYFMQLPFKDEFISMAQIASPQKTKRK